MPPATCWARCWRSRSACVAWCRCTPGRWWLTARRMLFAGAAGAGKSSTVAALGALGHEVLSDDVVPLSVTPVGRRRARLSARQRLGRHGVGASGPWRAGTAAVERQLRQALHRPATSRASAFTTPRAGGGQSTCCSRRAVTSRRRSALTPREALLALAANTYGGYLLDRRMREMEFDVLGSVARAVPVSPLRFDDDLSRLPGACAALAASLVAGDCVHCGPGSRCGILVSVNGRGQARRRRDIHSANFDCLRRRRDPDSGCDRAARMTRAAVRRPARVWSMARFMPSSHRLACRMRLRRS